MNTNRRYKSYISYQHSISISIFVYNCVVSSNCRCCYKNTNKQWLNCIIFFSSVKTERVFFTMLTKFTKLSQQYNNIIQYHQICPLQSEDKLETKFAK